jgi:hypothetical protein
MELHGWKLVAVYLLGAVTILSAAALLYTVFRT